MLAQQLQEFLADKRVFIAEEHCEEIIRFIRPDTSRKLDQKQVIAIHKLHELGWSVKELAAQFGVHTTTVYRLLKGEHHIWAASL